MFDFEVGSPIVHPIHGAGILTKIDQRQVRGRLLNYYVIDFPYSDLGNVMVPIDMADKVGLRTVSLDDCIDDIFNSLGESFTEEEEEESKSFHQRYRDYLEKIQSGDLSLVARVYRLLFRRSMIKPLGTKDKALFETARQLLISEIVFAKDVVDSEARAMLDEAMEDMIF
jgi:CarD family transcriptional regulator